MTDAEPKVASVQDGGRHASAGRGRRAPLPGRLPCAARPRRDAGVVPTVAWELAAAGFGLVGLAAMAVQFVTSGRFEIVSGRLGIDRVMAFHKTAAWWVLLALLLHPVVYRRPTFLADPALGWSGSGPITRCRITAAASSPCRRLSCSSWDRRCARVCRSATRPGAPRI